MFDFLGSKRCPKGPDLSTVKEHKLNLSGTSIYFTTPENNNPDQLFEPLPDRYNIYDELNYSSFSIDRENSSYLRAYLEHWVFRGNLFFKKIGDLDFSAGVIRNTNFGSLYQPDNFVEVVNHCLNYSVGPLSNSDKDDFKARKNWSIQNIDNSHFINYEIHRSNTLHTDCFWETPLSVSGNLKV